MDYIRDIGEFNSALTLSQDLLNREYLKQLKSMPILSISDMNDKCAIRLIKLNNISETYSDNLLDRVMPALNALHHLKVSIGYIVQITPTRVNTYLAIKSAYDINTALKIIQNTLSAKHSDMLIKVLDEKFSCKILNQSLFDITKLTSLSSVTLNTDTFSTLTDLTSSKLKSLLCAMYNETFTILFLAIPTEQTHINDRIYQLENLFTLLDSFKETTFTYNKTFTDSCTNNKSDTKYKSALHTDTKTDKKETLKRCTLRSLDSLILNMKVDDNFNYIINSQPSKEEELKNICTTSDTQTDTVHNTFTDLTSNSETTSKANNSTYSFKGENKTAMALLKKADACLTKLYNLQHLPTFNLGIYFSSPHAYTTLRATFTYLDLLKNNKSCFQDYYVNTWDKEESSFSAILSYLPRLSHPSFIRGRNRVPLSPTAFLDHQSLAKLICIPTSTSLD
ncbi:hypothetical protein [Cellulosilyticum sp. I15G10I2]|uniref:hypothetical protein n=1 Tax=Cellulosilyticum sp. I15G10I2 TaxID=1892843 RepID=UPI00085C2607|nr:hypothetical protein [Cellulosilyticum sp. I15G10I2]